MIGYLALTLTFVLIDRALKIFMSSMLAEGSVIPLIPRIIQLRYVENTGAAFGLFKNATNVLSIITSLLILGLLYLIVSKKFSGKLINLALVFILAGGMGNLYDRIVNGFVVDYLEFTFVNYAVFNFADSLINVGAVLIFVYIIFFDRRHSTEMIIQEEGKSEKKSQCMRNE